MKQPQSLNEATIADTVEAEDKERTPSSESPKVYVIRLGEAPSDSQLANDPVYAKAVRILQFCNLIPTNRLQTTTPMEERDA